MYISAPLGEGEIPKEVSISSVLSSPSTGLFDKFVRAYLIYKAYSSNEKFKADKGYHQARAIYKFPDLGYSPKSLVKATADRLKSKLVYISDPITFDYYTHPLVTEFQTDPKSNKQHSCDCDDYATYAYALLAANGYPKDQISVCTIVPDLLKNAMDIKWCHVILVGKLPNPNKEPIDFYFTIDTNGLYYFSTPTGGGTVVNTVLRYFSGIYKVEYKQLFDHGYPFKGEIL